MMLRKSLEVTDRCYTHRRDLWVNNERVSFLRLKLNVAISFLIMRLYALILYLLK